jgi:Domain of Unknown Function (DUF1206)
VATDATSSRQDAGPHPGQQANEAADSTGLRRLAALGLVGYAVIHLLIGWLALTLAWFESSPAGNGQRPTDSSGALALLARNPVGAALLWVLAVGLAALCLWQASEVLRHNRQLPPPGRDRRDALLQLVKTVGTAAFYGYLAVSAVRTALGHGQGRGTEQHTLAGVLGLPGGHALVTAIGAVCAGIGVYLVQKGVRSGFTDEIDLGTVAPSLRAGTHRVCQVGFVLKGVALVLVGVVVGWAAVTARPDRGDGMDGALRVVAGQPFGQWLLTVIAVGLAAFAVYCLVRARHPVG